MAAYIAYKTIPVVIRLSHRKGLTDDPGEGRKIHLHQTPNLGGIALYAAIVVIFGVSGYAQPSWVPYLISGMTVLFFSGIKDDILAISPGLKLVLQLAAIGFLVIGGGVMITHFGGMLGLAALPPWGSYCVTFFTMVVVLNAYNLIDGIDGLAGSVGVLSLSLLGAWFYWVGLYEEAALAGITVGALAGFLWFNVQPAAIFMGDTGSQLVGYILGFLCLRFVNYGLTGGSELLFHHAAPVLVLAIIIVPLYDTLRVFMIRVAQGRSPFSPDRLHVHHQLMDAGFSHRSCVAIIMLFNVIIIGIGVAVSSLEINTQFVLVLLSAMLLFPTMRFKRRLLLKLGVPLPSPGRVQAAERKFKVAPKRKRRKE